ncbi:hypothetical protein LshimejAT787_0602340 [Lyophyllum shimeji]|uniref:Uncharacterized protein n=1 Tax=Lyophyllum shimeji TaxID=47721 RepID=A0A9P3UN89_LYOSH|nr:hypothetical protein LshimejAT787_0602340 [Lyophyllum shimeji]
MTFHPSYSTTNMYPGYTPFGFEESYFEGPPTPSPLDTLASTRTYTPLSHQASFEGSAETVAAASTAGPSTVYQMATPQMYMPSTPMEFPPTTNNLPNAYALGYNGSNQVVPPPSNSHGQLFVAHPAGTSSQINPAYNLYQPARMPPPSSPTYQLTTIDPAATVARPGSVPPQAIMQYGLTAVNPSTMGSVPVFAYNAIQPSIGIVNSDPGSPVPSAETPDVVSGSSQPSGAVKGLQWKNPMVPANPAPPVAHVPTEGKRRTSTSKGKGKGKKRSRGSSEAEEERGALNPTSSQLEGTATANVEFINTSGAPAKKQKRISADQSTPIPGQHCYRCKKNFARPDTLARHLRADRCKVDSAPITAMTEAKAPTIVEGSSNGGQSGSTTTFQMESTAGGSSAPVAADNNTQPNAQRPVREEAGDHQDPPPGSMANPITIPPSPPVPEFSAQVVPHKHVAPPARTNGKHGEDAAQGNGLTTTPKMSDVSIAAAKQVAQGYALPMNACIPSVQSGGAGYVTQMAYSQTPGTSRAIQYSQPSYGLPAGSDSQQYFRSDHQQQYNLSGADQGAHVGTSVAHAQPPYGGPRASTGTVAPHAGGFYHPAQSGVPHHRGEPNPPAPYIPSAGPSGQTPAGYYMPPAAHQASFSPQNTASNAHQRFNFTYPRPATQPYPQQPKPHVQQSQTSSSAQQPEQHPTPANRQTDVGHVELVNPSFSPPGEEVVVDAPQHQAQVGEYQSNDRLHDSTNTHTEDTYVHSQALLHQNLFTNSFVDRGGAGPDPAAAHPAPPSQQQARKRRTVKHSRLGGGNTSHVGFENTQPVIPRPAVNQLNRGRPSQGQLSTSSVQVSSKPVRHTFKGLPVGIALPIIAVPGACEIFSSSKMEPSDEEDNGADSDDGLFTDRACASTK